MRPNVSKQKATTMRWFHTVILLAVLVLTVGCLPMTPAEAGFGVFLLGFGFVVWGLGLSSALFTVERKKLAALLVVLGACFLIGGGLIALGGRMAGWWGQ
jgi:hypothetical protein